MSSNAEPASSGVPCTLQKKVEQLLRTHIQDPETPSLDEVRKLAYELELRQSELERQNEELRKARQDMEANRDRYVDLYDTAPVGYVTLDSEGYVQEINLAGAKLLNVERDALTGYSFLDYVAVPDAVAFLQHLRECTHERRETVTEISVVSKNGRTIAVQLHSIAVACPDDDQEVLCKTAIADITARKELEESLREREQWFGALAEDAPVGIVEADAQGEGVYVNRYWCKMTGMTAEQARGNGWTAAVHPDDRERVVSAWREAVAAGREVAMEFRYRTPDGRTTHVLGAAKPRTDERGEGIGYLGIVQDVSKWRTAGAERGTEAPEAAVAGDGHARSEKDIRVLLADDHQLLREGLATLLRDQPGIEVVGEASDGREAVDMALQTHPDVVLMDVTMPGLNGIEATRSIKAALPNASVIGLSMHEADEMAGPMRNAGAAAYLAKTGSADALIEAIRAASPDYACPQH
jgi:PAS domain S-box-containing protein